MCSAFVRESVGEKERSAVNSLIAMVGGMGRGGLGPVISGYLQQFSGGGFGMAIAFTLLTHLVSTALTWSFFGRRSREQRAAG